MLQRLLAYDELYGDGLWSREQLEQMNNRFVTAVESAFRLGLESREGAIQAAWDLLCSKEGDVSFSEIVAFVRERCPNIDQTRVRFGFEQRLRQRGVGW